MPKKTIIIGSIAIGTMLIVTYYCNNKVIQFISLCITAIYAIATNIDMLKLGIELVKKKLCNKNDRGINGRKNARIGGKNAKKCLQSADYRPQTCNTQYIKHLAKLLTLHS